MAATIRMPKGGQTTDISTIIAWHKNIGDQVKRGDLLFEIETDKATLPVESFAEGILAERYFEAGDEVTAEEAVALIRTEKDQPDAIPAPKPPAPTISPPANTLAGNAEALRDIMTNRAVAIEAAHGIKLLASPKARKWLSDHHIPYDYAASAFPGRIVTYALARELSGTFALAPPAVTADSESAPEFIIEKWSGMRKVIAGRMGISAATPQFSLTMPMAMEAFEAVRASLKQEGHPIAIHDLFMLCACRALKAYPNINAHYDEAGLKRFSTVNFGLAVSVTEGLIVPVVRHAELKTLAEIAGDTRDIIAAAREGKTDGLSLSGSSITLTNLGMYGIEQFTALINPPECCILALGCMRPHEGALEMKVTASFDHRCVDGAYGAAFLKELRRIVENPSLLMLSCIGGGMK